MLKLLKLFASFFDRCLLPVSPQTDRFVTGRQRKKLAHHVIFGD